MKRPIRHPLRTSLLAGSIALLGATAAAAEVIRHPIPGSDFPIAQAVEVTPGTTIVYHSGTVPSPINRDAEPGSREFWGDTEAQTLSVFSKLEASLEAKDLSFSDVIKMQIYLVGVPELDGAMDFQGMMRAYRKYFGTEAQPNLPARSAFQVAGLAAPGMLVEIEVVLARPGK
jgi:enamine deaminase RidA (YjgF/YER057c/UK114 family)